MATGQAELNMLALGASSIFEPFNKALGGGCEMDICECQSLRPGSVVTADRGAINGPVPCFEARVPRDWIAKHAILT